MYVSKENEKFYLNAWNFNKAMILTKLAEIVSSNGGECKGNCKTAILVNRSVREHKEHIKQTIARWERFLQKENDIDEKTQSIATQEIANKKLELEKLPTEEKEFSTKYTDYVTFTLDGYLYYYQIDENPFFEFYFSKKKIQNGKVIVSRQTYSQHDNKEWFLDCYMSAKCTESEITEAAYQIFNMLVSSKVSDIALEAKRIRVDNTYDSGYHYETVREKIVYESVKL